MIFFWERMIKLPNKHTENIPIPVVIWIPTIATKTTIRQMEGERKKDKNNNDDDDEEDE